MRKEKDNDYLHSNFQNIQKSIILSSPIRLTIMLLLFKHNSILISRLQKILSETSGNLNYHLKILENKDFLQIKPELKSKRILNKAEITKAGITEIKKQIKLMKDVFKSFESDNVTESN